MKIGGIQKTSLIDYPDKVCAVFFASGCNFRCPYCYNPELVFNKTKLINEKWIKNFLEQRKSLLDAILLTGGEITIQQDFVEFLKEIKKYGYLVGIETNGSKPDAIKKIIDNKIVDFIAMDIKSDLETYEKAVGVKLDKEKIKKSVELIKNSNINYEFRTTVVPELFDEETAIKIGKWLKGSKRYVLQQFNNEKGMINKNFKREKPYAPDKLKKFKKILGPYITDIRITGI